MAHAMPGHNTTPMPLRSYVDRLVRLEEQKKEIAADIKDVRSEAKSVGFDVKVLGQMVKEAMMSVEQREARREFEEICEVYRANLGMLGGTPLGEAARKRAAAPAEPEADEDETGEEDEQPADAEAEEQMPEEDIDAAREKGRQAAHAGEKIFANPYVNGDPRRAAWDEGWCEGSGSDGMEVPDAWRRKLKPKKDDEGKESRQ